MRHGILLLLILSGCYSVAEHNAKEWVEQKAVARPIHSLWCDEDWDGDNWVICSISVESVGKLFNYKLKCYNSSLGYVPFKDRCQEVWDG